MKVAAILGEALGERFRDPTRLADISGVTLLRHDRDDPVACLYAPPLADGDAPVISISRRVSGRDRDAMIAIGLGHLFGRHRSRQLYTYSDSGPTFDEAEEVAQAKEFARRFLRYSRSRRVATRAAG